MSNSILSKNRFIIKDWADNVCFQGIEFPTFEDAWGYIYENVKDEDNAYDDYFVEVTS